MTEKEARYTIDPEGKVVVFPRRQQIFAGPNPVVYGQTKDGPKRAASIVLITR